jgi:hypothetical protein
MITAPSGTVYTGAIKEAYYELPSRSEPGTVRRVYVNPFTGRPMRCTCPAWRTCWHQQAVTDGQAGKVHLRYGPVVAREVRRPAAAISDLYA